MLKSRNDKEQAYYKANFSTLLKRYPGKVLVIYGEEVIGVFSSLEEAAQLVMDRKLRNKALIRECVPG